MLIIIFFYLLEIEQIVIILTKSKSILKITFSMKITFELFALETSMRKDEN